MEHLDQQIININKSKARNMFKYSSSVKRSSRSMNHYRSIDQRSTIGELLTIKFSVSYQGLYTLYSLSGNMSLIPFKRKPQIFFLTKVLTYQDTQTLSLQAVAILVSSHTLLFQEGNPCQHVTPEIPRTTTKLDLLFQCFENAAK